MLLDSNQNENTKKKEERDIDVILLSGFRLLYAKRLRISAKPF